jgi:putative IMPACT (imprinted ancient) family translation regulator
MPRYPVPDGKYRAEYLQSNSRFIATLLPVATMEEAREALAQVREEMPDATHHVHAARVGFGSSVTDRMSDDGEPSGTVNDHII